MDVFGGIADFFSSPLFGLATKLLLLFIVIIWFSLVFWTYRDAQRRGILGIYWAAVVFFFWFFGWAIYLILRPPEYLEDAKERELDIKSKEAILSRRSSFCPACGKPVESDFLICPYCLEKLKQACPECNRALQMNWTVCPYCKTNL